MTFFLGVFAQIPRESHEIIETVPRYWCRDNEICYGRLFNIFFFRGGWNCRCLFCRTRTGGIAWFIYRSRGLFFCSVRGGKIKGVLTVSMINNLMLPLLGFADDYRERRPPAAARCPTSILPLSGAWTWDKSRLRNLKSVFNKSGFKYCHFRNVAVFLRAMNNCFFYSWIVSQQITCVFLACLEKKHH